MVPALKAAQATTFGVDLMQFISCSTLAATNLCSALVPALKAAQATMHGSGSGALW